MKVYKDVEIKEMVTELQLVHRLLHKKRGESAEMEMLTRTLESVLFTISEGETLQVKVTSE